MILPVSLLAFGIDAIATIACGKFSAVRLVSTIRGPGKWTKPVYVLTDRPESVRNAHAVDISLHQPKYLNKMAKKNTSLIYKWYKTQLFELLPVTTVLYIDADVEVVQPISQFWKAVSRPHCSAFFFNERWYTQQLTGRYNSGIAVFHKTKSASLLSAWSNAILSSSTATYDQLLLKRAIKDSKCTVCTIPKKHIYFAADLWSAISFWKTSYTFVHYTGRKSLTNMATQFEATDVGFP